MSFKSLFVKEETSTAKSKETKKPQDTTPHQDTLSISSVQPINTDFSAASVPTDQVTGTEKSRFMKFFRDVMIKNNIPGPDYEEFVLALDGMKMQPMDEASKFKNVFITLGSMGLTVPKLIEAANFYKQCYDKEKQKFDNDVANLQKNEIVSRENQVKDLSAKNSAIDTQMSELNKQKLANEQTISKINDEKQKKAAAISSQSADFNAAYKDSIAEIDHNVELINKYLAAEPAVAQ